MHMTPSLYDAPADQITYGMVRDFVLDAERANLLTESLTLELKRERSGRNVVEAVQALSNGLVIERTTIVAPVHSLQVVDEEIPETEHDFSVDLIVTPDEVIRCSNPRQPHGVIWKDLTPEKIAAIPVLGSRR